MSDRIHAASIEALESRTLLATTPQISFPDFASTSGLVSNGFGGSAINVGDRLRLTDGGLLQRRSVWSQTRVPIDQFTTHFSFQSNASAVSADGLTFTVQNGPTSALGLEGNNLGYTGIGNSAGVAFNLYNLHAFGSRFGFVQDGAFPVTDTDMSPLDLHGGGIFDATVEYDGSTLSVAVMDRADPSAKFNASRQIDIPAEIGSDDAIVGFTASTGQHFSTQDILKWDFTGEPEVEASGPTFTTAATATPDPVVGKFTNLSALATDPAGEENLTYTWTTLRKPPGAKDPVFSDNATNAAKAITARFSKDGTFSFRVTVTNESGGSATSDVSVVVQQTPANMRIYPHKPQVPLGGRVDFRASVLDQFNHLMRTQPPISFSVKDGPGTIDPVSGLFTATATTTGHFVITASTVNDLFGNSAGTVIA
jgi:hypothetical protein